MSNWNWPLEELYFGWLCAPLDERMDLPFDVDTLVELHNTPFKTKVRRDRNRAEDGLRLRQEFVYQTPDAENYSEYHLWLDLDCSVLEMMLALADRMAYQTSRTIPDWFATMLRNLGLPAESKRATKQIIRRLNDRTYDWDGTGGLFPLLNPMEDQTKVEIWYQMSAYIIENYDGGEV